MKPSSGLPSVASSLDPLIPSSQSGWQDLNLRSPSPEPGAMTKLRHSLCDASIILGIRHRLSFFASRKNTQSTRRDSNPRHSPYKGPALPPELRVEGGRQAARSRETPPVPCASIRPGGFEPPANPLEAGCSSIELRPD